MTVAEQAAPPPRQQLLLDRVSWDYYERTLREVDEQHLHLRITYDRGRMEIVSPSPKHERVKKSIATLIECYALERGIWFLGLGSVACRREDLERGLEPDECYYISHRLRNEDELDLTIDPPPDLAVEVDITRSSIDRQPIYGELGVPEVWRFDGQRIVVLLRGADGMYQASPRSQEFPELSMPDLNRFLAMALMGKQYEAVVGFRDWLRGH